MTTAQALESVLNAWVNGRKVRDGIPLTIRQQAEQALLTADAQATVEALQAIIKQMGGQAAVLAKDGMAAKAQVEALQRERDEWRSNAVAQEARANDLERDCKDLLSDIDGERAKVGDLLKKIAYWEKRHSTYRELAEENMNLKSDELSALQGLVRALQREREKVKGLHEITKVICTHCCEPMEIPSKAVLQTQLSQLQALEAMTERERVRYRQALCSIATSTCCVGCEEAKKVARATLSEDVQTWEQYRATLAATTPATHDQAKATVFNEWDGALRKMADVEPEGGDGE